MRCVDADGVTLHVRADGDPTGVPVVFANSLGTDLRLWDDVNPLLPKGLRIIRYDKRGHGLSDCPSGPYSIDVLAAEAIACCEAIAAADLTGATRMLHLPNLVIAGSHDCASPAELVSATADMIEGTEFHVIDGAGHLPCVENPAAFAAILTPFLKEYSHA